MDKKPAWFKCQSEFLEDAARQRKELLEKLCVKKRMWKFQQVNYTKLLFLLYVCTGTVQPLVSQDWQWIWLRVSSIAKSRKNGSAYK